MSSSEATSSKAEEPSPPPCAGCKHLRRRCVPSCAFASYFPPEHGDQFAAVHKVFGASNVSKLLAEVAPGERAGAVESLVYEATARLRDPAFGCASYITVLEHMLKQGVADIAAARGQLAAHVGADAAFRPLDPRSASPEARRAGEERLDAALRFAREQDDKMRAVRAALDAKRKQGSVVAWKDAVKRGQGQPLLNRQMAEAQQAAAAAQFAREQAVKVQQSTATAQQHGHRTVAQHAGTRQGFPDGHPRQQMAEAAREQAMVAQQHRHAVAQAQHGTGLAVDGHYVATGRDHPRTALQMAHEQQVAAAEENVWEQEMILRQATAAAAELTGNRNMLAMMQQDAATAEELTRDQNVMMMMQQAVAGQNMMVLDATLVHGLHGHHPDLRQKTAQQVSAAAAEVATEHQGLMMMQPQQQHAAAYAHAMPGATNMAFHPGASADAEAFLVQPQKVNALAFQTDSSLPPSLAISPRQQPIDGGDHDDKLSDLTAYVLWHPWSKTFLLTAQDRADHPCYGEKDIVTDISS